MSERILVTAALPYANGSIHIGHLVEHVMTDTYVRALKLAGKDAYFICADDTHGTPIELSAKKANIPPEEYIAQIAKEHVEDFASFDIAFDYYGSTNSEENRRWVHEIYEALKKSGAVEKRPLQQLYDETAQRFLPDRFVKGTCPKCNTPDQYGDACEACGSTYEPTDLKDPVSAISGAKPVLRESEHLYVKLTDFQASLVSWVNTPGRLQPETRKFCDSWIEGGLKDWCISRDAPYFGFEIPDQPKKYFYVWIDAPVGYIASTESYGKSVGKPKFADEIWRDRKTKIVHVIGKDIVYFHTLFWPAMLEAAKLTVPTHVHVHGMLTIDGVKMSKSRGTFINGRTFKEHIDPGYLRYYYASKIGPKTEDIDLSIDEFVNRVNAELVNNLANLVARGVPFIAEKLGGRYGKLPADAGPHVEFVKAKVAEAKTAYDAFDLATAVRCAVEIANLGNKIFQDAQPWKMIHGEPEKTRDIVTLCLNIARAAWVMLSPATPRWAETVYSMLGLGGVPKTFDEAVAFDLIDRSVGPAGRIADRITKKQFEAIIEASKDGTTPVAKAPPKKPEAPPKKDEAPPAMISIEDFAKIDLRVGLVKEAANVEGADKLLKLTVDLGEEKPRTIFAGIRSAYEAETLIGRRVVVVANLAPRKMRFGMSEGMVLAAGPGGKEIWVLDVSAGAPIGSSVK